MSYVIHSVAVEVTGELAANAFWEMDDDEQSKFFNTLGRTVDTDDLKCQLSNVISNKLLTKEGRDILSVMFGYE